MKYHYEVPVNRSEYIKTYVAEITGGDPKYLLKRRFIRRSFKECAGVRSYRYDIGGHGVFEQSIKHYNRRNDELISRERKWFVYYQRKFYEIESCEALFCAYNLKAQYDVVKELDPNAPKKDDIDRMRKILGNMFSADIQID